jgi:hypothetical protein
MSCTDCGNREISSKCPECGNEYCEDCEESQQGRCYYCAPELEDVNK